ncbi:hypothetical protein ACK3TF_003588 [Chlorella vulgaris]
MRDGQVDVRVASQGRLRRFFLPSVPGWRAVLRMASGSIVANPPQSRHRSDVWVDSKLPAACGRASLAVEAPDHHSSAHSAHSSAQSQQACSTNAPGPQRTTDQGGGNAGGELRSCAQQLGQPARCNAPAPTAASPAPLENTAAGGIAVDASTSPASSPGAAAVFTVVAPLQLQSPFGVSWREVLEHTATRLSWTDPAFRLSLHDAQLLAGDDEGASSSRSALLADVRRSQAAVAIGVADATAAAALAPLLAEASTAVALGSAQQLQAATRLGGRTPGGSLGFLQRLLGGKQAAVDEQVLHTIAELYERASSDDFLFVFLVLANSYIKEVPAVAMSFAQKNAGLQELKCMVTNCGGQIFRCVTDTSCKAALDCLTGCEFNDQVPDPAPLASFGGQPMTHELAEDLFIGWLDADSTTSLDRPSALQPFSWRVFAGKNAAYDFFNCQYQLFYRGKGKGGMWYDPSFKVLDNGVTSNEFWRILDCEEGLDWCVFYYSGAASRAGLSYSGAILASKSGEWPESQAARQRIEAVLDLAGIKTWELSNVDNSNCVGAPLDRSLLTLA